LEAFGALSGIVVVLFILIAGILAILMPFFVLRIRNEMIKLNENMAKVIELLGGSTSENRTGNPETRKIKICPYCQAKNRVEDYLCINCSKPI